MSSTLKLFRFFMKYFFNWGSSFWLTSFWGCSLEFQSVITASANWGEVFDLEIPSWFLLHTKLSEVANLFFHFVLAEVVEKCIFSHFVALKTCPCRVSRRFLLDLNLYFAVVYLFHYYLKKKKSSEIIYIFSFERLIS